ncbi:HEPN domain-containing protein [Acidianus infernus]|uniref:HEPN domain-containing protein n=1 Tax=Acidianus infernus TaxID=12915 RepID=UPI0030B7F604
MPTRYPDVWPSGYPGFYYTKSEAEEAIKYAEDIIKFIEEERRIKERGRVITEARSFANSLKGHFSRF